MVRLMMSLSREGHGGMMSVRRDGHGGIDDVDGPQSHAVNVTLGQSGPLVPRS